MKWLWAQKNYSINIIGDSLMCRSLMCWWGSMSIKLKDSIIVKVALRFDFNSVTCANSVIGGLMWHGSSHPFSTSTCHMDKNPLYLRHGQLKLLFFHVV